MKAAVSITADMDDAVGNSAAQATANLGKDIVAPAIAITGSSVVITSANESALQPNWYMYRFHH